MSGRKILAVDAGFANVGLAVMEHRTFTDPLQQKWWPIDMACLQTVKSDKKIGLLQADDSARRIAEAVRGVKAMVDKHEIRAMVAEMPNAGGQNATAVRGMAYAAAMLVTLKECLGLAAEWYTPNDTRAAAGVPRAAIGRDAVKKMVMAEMGRRYPSMVPVFPTQDKREHVADALACFEAARHGNLVRMMEGG